MMILLHSQKMIHVINVIGYMTKNAEFLFAQDVDAPIKLAVLAQTAVIIVIARSAMELMCW